MCFFVLVNNRPIGEYLLWERRRREAEAVKAGKPLPKVSESSALHQARAVQWWGQALPPRLLVAGWTEEDLAEVIALYERNSELKEV